MGDFTFTTNLGRITDHSVAFFPDRLALLQDGLELTYRELDRRIDQVANGLISAGVAPGDRVLIIWHGDVRFVEVVLGTIRAGAVAVPVNPNLPTERHLDIATDCDAVYVLASSVGAASAASLLGQGVVQGAAAVEPIEGVQDFERWRDAQHTETPDHSPELDDVAWLAYTSGSTGVPKGVLIPHRMLLRNAQWMTHAMFIDPTDRVVVSTPLFHMNACAVALLPCLSAGGSAYLLPGFDGPSVLRAIEEKKCTYITGVPAMYKMLIADDREIEARDLSSLKKIACGSAPMPPALLDRLLEVFDAATFSEGYGLTEVGPVATLVPRMGVPRLGSIGRPFPGMELRVVDSAGDELPVGETGELWMRGECMTLGYHNRPEENARRMKPDGWFATGDLVTIDDAGWLYFRGRADDMMSVGGENVYPAEVESIIVQHDKVRDACVVAAPHDVKGEIPVAYVVLREGCDLSADELKAFCIARGPAFAHPRRVEVLEAMPLAPTGKVDRRALTQRAVAQNRPVATAG